MRIAAFKAADVNGTAITSTSYGKRASATDKKLQAADSWEIVAKPVLVTFLVFACLLRCVDDQLELLFYKSTFTIYILYQID